MAPFEEKEVINDVGLQPSNNTELLPEENLNKSQSSSDKVVTDSSAKNEPENISEQEFYVDLPENGVLQTALFITMNTCANLKGGVNDIVWNRTKLTKRL